MLTLNDGRSELWQWDTGRKLTVDADCSQVHFSNKAYGRSIDVDVVDGTAEIPDVLLQVDKPFFAWAFVGAAENGYTKIGKTFIVNRKNKPADYVFTPPEQTTLAEIMERLDELEAIQDPDAIKNAVDEYLSENPVDVPVQSVNGKTGEVQLNAKDVGAISQDDLQKATNEALEQAKESGEFDGEPGDNGATFIPSVSADGVISWTNDKYLPNPESVNIKGESGDDGFSPVVSVTTIDGGHKVEITDAEGVKSFTVMDGKDAEDGTGGEENPYELIDTITLAEDAASVIRSAEPSGTAYNFKKVIIYAIFSANGTATGNVSFAVYAPRGTTAKAKLCAYTIANCIQNASARYVQCRAEISNGVDLSECTDAGMTTESRTTLYRQPGISNTWSGYINDIRVVSVTSGVNIPTGTKIYIFGVRA